MSTIVYSLLLWLHWLADTGLDLSRTEQNLAYTLSLKTKDCFNETRCTCICHTRRSIFWH